MKKILCLLLMLIIFSLSACKHGDVTKEVQYSYMEALYRPFKNVQELVESADIVYIGKVTGISFQMLDLTTALPPTKDTEDRHIKLHTIYDIDVEIAYKGYESKQSKIRMLGGIMNYCIEEQLEILKEYSQEGILVMEEEVNLEIGEIYLVTLCDFGTGIIPTNMFPDQSIYNLHDPFEKHTKNITAKDVISTFGQDKWDEFWTQWQKDNPKWETWLDKAEVEAELQKN